MTRARVWFLELATFAALAASLAPLGAKLWWGFELASHFRLQYVLVDAALLAVLAFRRRWLWSGALAVCVAWNAVWVAPYAPGMTANAAPQRGGSTVEILAANLLFVRDPQQRLLDIVRAESPDVVVLVEYTPEWAASADALRAEYPHRIEAPAYGAFGIALFSRFPLDAGAPFMLGDTSAVEAQVRTPAGPLDVIGVHLRSPTTPEFAAERNRQLTLLAERLAAAPRPVAVLGDFNISPYSPFYRDFIEQTGFTDTRLGRTLSPSWPAFLPILGIPIDHCIVSRDITIVAHRGLPRFGSDHYPILAELALPDAPAGVTNATGLP